MAVDTTSIIALYDSLIAKHKELLDAEVVAKKIDSDMYSKALLALMEQTMQLSTTTTQQQPMTEAQTAEVLANTNRQNSESSARIALTAEQTQSEAKQNELGGVIDRQIGKLTAETLLSEGQTAEILASTTRQNAQSAKDLLVKDAQISEMGAREILIDNQAATELKQALDIVSSTSVRNEQSTKDLLVKDAQIIEIEERADLLQSQDLEILASTTRQNNESSAKIGLITEQKESEAKQNILNGVIDKQIEKLTAETLLAEQKIVGRKQ